ncbi:tyrosine-type recombinase/integrase [Marinobacterium weihaiense]|uniref:Integrase arm-type DNA-binding domain-containing protein n=1 Tax=Marinobacterium weihaiense TaxID=2851016 RepID=A0ABS6M8Z6_9GAMM|nr:site-specific integrase [Marinobacterium weihaiense]MBV0932366.1 integrase arm-type DNA-binding domain-containing protein [Marinobacterium weihaiense]
MPRKARELSATEVRRLVEPGRYPVGGVAGLLLQVTSTGARSWLLRTKVGDKRRDIGLGGFPDVTLAGARQKARDVKEQIMAGIDPVAERKAHRDAIRAAQAKALSFEEAARRCHDARKDEFSNPKHRQDWINSLERHAFPELGELPVDAIELPHVLKVLEPIWKAKTETATRVRQRVESVLSWATVSGHRIGENPARWPDNLDQLLPTPSKIRKVKHHKALPWQEVPAFWADLRQRDGMGARALEFILLTAARSGEVRFATWDEIDLAAKIWTVPAERMKARKDHRVPLSESAIELLQRTPRMEGSKLLFTAPRGNPLSDMSISAVCKRMEVDATPHGFRSCFKDWARSRTAYPDEVSELALAHVNSDATRAAYARDELLPQRTRMMADWAKFLSESTLNGEVVPIRGEVQG